MVAGTKDLPLDLKFSFALVAANSDFRGIENYRKTLDSTASLVNVKIDIAAAVLKQLAGDVEFADNLLKAASFMAQAINQSNASERLELKVNQNMDSQ
jgi:ketosteroid isomerase-like protein